MSRIAVVVPAYNEERAITDVVSAIHKVASDNQLNIDVVVVNDCSTDQTLELVKALDCVCLNLPVNVGIGGAVQTGFMYARNHGYDFAIQLDGDGQHPPSEIIKLIKAQREHQLDVTIGSRYIDKEGFQSSRARRTGIRYFRFLNKLLTGVLINDSTSGFRMIGRKVIELVSDYYPDEYPEPEAIVLYAQHNLKIGETAVVMQERQGGKTSIGFFASIYYMVKVTIAIIFTYIRVKQHKRHGKH